MFGKKGVTNAERLSERMRKAVERDVAPPPTHFSWPRQIERAVRQAVFRQGALIMANGEKVRVAVKDLALPALALSSSHAASCQIWWCWLNLPYA